MLDQVPPVAVEVFEHGDRTVGFFGGFPDESNSAFDHLAMVVPEIISFQKQKDASAVLIADECFLLGISGTFKQDPAVSFTPWRDDDPSLLLFRECRVFKQTKIEFLREKLNGFIVVSDKQTDLSDGLCTHRRT